MDPSQPPLIIAYILTLIGSAYFSAAENSISAINRIRMRTLADDGKRRARIVLFLADRFEQVITTILIGVNLLQLGGAAIATQFVYNAFRDRGVNDGVITLVVTVSTAVIAYFFADMLPKSFAMARPDGFALALAPSLAALTFLLYPVTLVFRGIGFVARSLFRVREEPTVTEEEISTLIDTAEEEGVFDEEQSDLLQSALEFSETTVSDVLTLRDDIVGIEAKMSHEEILGIIKKNKLSRFPVYENDLDHIIGILQVKNYLKARLAGSRKRLRSLVSPVFYTTLDAGIDGLLGRMSKNKVTMAIVRDGEGHTIGLVTTEDFLEELVGEIFDEDDVVNDRFMKLGGNYFRVSATCTMGEMFRDMSYHGKVNMSRLKTVNTWVLENLGHAPERDDTFTWRDLTVTVTDAEEGRLSFVEIKLADPVLDAVEAPAENEGEVTEA